MPQAVESIKQRLSLLCGDRADVTCSAPVPSSFLLHEVIRNGTPGRAFDQEMALFGRVSRRIPDYALGEGLQSLRCDVGGRGKGRKPGATTGTSATMLQDSSEVIEGFRRTLLATQPEGVAGSWAAVRDYDLRRTATLIHNPTLVIAGEHDTVTSADHGKELAATVPGARFTLLPTVHMANVEGQAEFLDAAVAFLAERS